MTKTQQLIAGLLADGWTPVITQYGKEAYTRRLEVKAYTRRLAVAVKAYKDTIQAWAFVSKSATLRVSLGSPAFSRSVASPKLAARMIDLGAPKTTNNLLNELERI